MSTIFHFLIQRSLPCCIHCLNEQHHHLSQYKNQLYGSHFRFIHLPYIPDSNQYPCPTTAPLIYLLHISFPLILHCHLPKLSHVSLSSRLKQFYGFLVTSWSPPIHLSQHKNSDVIIYLRLFQCFLIFMME